MNLRSVVNQYVLFLLLIGLIGRAEAENIRHFQKDDTLRILVIGNSFSGNATRFLPDIAREGNHLLKIGRAELGGCSLERHWNLVRLSLDNPADPKGKPYHGASLEMLLDSDHWDIVTNTPLVCPLTDFPLSLSPEGGLSGDRPWIGEL